MELNQSSILIDRKMNAILRIPNNLRVVCEVVEKECAVVCGYSSKDRLNSLFDTLNYEEKSFMAHYFCQLSWNVSSVKVLGCLNQLRILTATEYIHSQTDDEHIQLVLNDFLETEFDLMANLIISGHYDLMGGSKIAEYISESIRRLFADLAKDPKLNNLEYIEALKSKIPRELHAKLVLNHLKIILSMHKSSVKSAFENFSVWLSQNSDENLLVHNFFKKAAAGNEFDVAKFLLNISSDVHFRGWRNYLLLLGLIARNSQAQCYSFTKKWLKDRIKTVAEGGSREIMAHLLLSVRAVLLFQEDKNETYACWYKQHIGDMKFVLNATEFKTMIAVLMDLVPYETDENYLEVHVRSSISPPVNCSELCRQYKVLCRARTSDLSDCTRMMQHGEDLFSDIEEIT